MYAKEKQEEYPDFNSIKSITERAICYALSEKNLVINDDFEVHKKIDNIAFTKSHKHEVDFVLKSITGNCLYVEVKGQMTYLEVNKLRYLLEHPDYDFYILQLTEIDWIEPFNEEEDAITKSKRDFTTQIDEMVKFCRGEITGKSLQKKTLKRLNAFINYRKKDLSRWLTIK